MASSAIAQKFTVVAKTNVASLEPGLSQHVVKSTFLYLKPTSGPRRMSNLLPSTLVRSTTTPTLNQLAGAQQTWPRPQPSSFLIHPSSPPTDSLPACVRGFAVANFFISSFNLPPPSAILRASWGV